MTRKQGPKIFAGAYPEGIVYADRHHEEHGDYKRLAFLPYRTLVLQFRPDCPADLKAEIERDAAQVIADCRQRNVSSFDQYITG